jgi:hypothetical protein
MSSPSNSISSSRRILIFFTIQVLSAVAFAPLSQPRIASSTLLAVKQAGSSDPGGAAVLEEEETPADIGGSKFFGGNKQKEELYDADAEARAGSEVDLAAEFYNKFLDGAAFCDPEVAKVASSLQSQINAVLYQGAATPNSDFVYASNMQWETPMSVNKQKSKNPLQELKNSLDFYKRVDVAIVSGRRLDDTTIELQWEISVVWPIFWEARVLLTGVSKLNLDGLSIVKQVDAFNDAKDVLSTIAPQVRPRFWDFYHVGMTPSTELMPRLAQKTSLWGYSVYEIPARLVSTPSQLDVGDRNDRNAQTIPNHSFLCVIKTMGPQRQRYIPASPVQVQIVPGGGNLMLKWSIPLSVEFQSNAKLPLPGPDPEAIVGSNPGYKYEFQPRRKVATMKFGGNAQDVEITEIRKKLYDQVIKDGLKPKLDKTGRPEYFFLQNAVKACYTEEGLGMSVYEWRPAFVKPNEVGIELESS